MTQPETLYVLSLALTDTDPEALNEWLTEHCPHPPVEMETPGSSLIWLESYFEEEAQALLIQEALRSSDFVLSASEIRPMPAQDWTTFWRHHFKPRKIGDRLLVLPEWMRDDPEWKGHEDRETVLINPGLSFGTGDHFTTRFCLEMLDRMVAQGVKPDQCFDAGCGSAILSIAARKFGWPSLFGVDVDPRSIEQAKENLELNEITDGIELQVMDLTQDWPADQYEVVFANIYGGMLMQLAQQLIDSTSRYLILSGIRQVETEAISSLFTGLGMKEVRCEGDHEWSGLWLEVPTESDSSD